MEADWEAIAPLLYGRWDDTARAGLVVQPGAGHHPWLDDPAWFTSAVASFLDGGFATPAER